MKIQMLLKLIRHPFHIIDSLLVYLIRMHQNDQIKKLQRQVWEYKRNEKDSKYLLDKKYQLIGKE